MYGHPFLWTLLQQRLGFAHDAALSNTLPVRMLGAGGFATIGPLARTLGQTDGISPAPVATLLDRRLAGSTALTANQARGTAISRQMLSLPTLTCFTFLRQLVGLASASLVATLQAEEATTGRVVVAITSASIAPFSSPGHIHTGGSYQIYQGNQEKNPRHVDSAVDLAVDLDIGILGSPY